MLIQFLDRKYIAYQKNAFLVIISMAVKQAHLEMNYNCQLIWLASDFSVSHHHLWTGFSVLDMRACEACVLLFVLTICLNSV